MMILGGIVLAMAVNCSPCAPPDESASQRVARLRLELREAELAVVAERVNARAARKKARP
jgi:hypothetical protein